MYICIYIYMSVYMSVLGWLSGKHSTSHGSCASCPSLDVPLYIHIYNYISFV